MIGSASVRHMPGVRGSPLRMRGCGLETGQFRPAGRFGSTAARKFCRLVWLVGLAARLESRRPRKVGPIGRRFVPICRIPRLTGPQSRRTSRKCRLTAPQSRLQLPLTRLTAQQLSSAPRQMWTTLRLMRIHKAIIASTRRESHGRRRVCRERRRECHERRCVCRERRSKIERRPFVCLRRPCLSLPSLHECAVPRLRSVPQSRGIAETKYELPAVRRIRVIHDYEMRSRHFELRGQAAVILERRRLSAAPRALCAVQRSVRARQACGCPLIQRE